MGLRTLEGVEGGWGLRGEGDGVGGAEMVGTQAVGDPRAP